VDNHYLDLGMNKSGFVHTLPSGRLILDFWLPPYNPRGERMVANSLGTLVHLLSYFSFLFS
jgi:hypothetical protein